jgi:putative Mg2+ transporter-C (MgtC) family protein
MHTLPALELLVRVGLATLLGVAIGVERQWRSRMAGLQTMALVSMGAALFLVLGAYTFHRDTDPTRVAAQIVTGVGFLGAGVIMKQGLSVTGLNTAATLWATSAVGALAGAWMWREAIAGAVVIVAGNSLLYPLGLRMDRVKSRAGREIPPAEYILDVVGDSAHEAEIRTRIVRAVAQPGLQLRSIGSSPATTGDQVQLRAELLAVPRDDSLLENAVSELGLEPQVRSARWAIQHEAGVDWTR